MRSLVRHASTALLATIIVASLVDTASAQFPRFNRRLFGTIPAENLARLEVVQKAINIDSDQKKLISAMNANRNDDQRDLFQSANGDFDAINKGIIKMNVEYFAKLKQVLDEKQQKRMTEIYYQVNNGSVLLDEPVTKLLKISDDQSKQLKSAVEVSRGEAFGALQSGQDKSEDERLKSQGELVEARDKKLLAILNEDQRKEFETAKGEKLAVDLDKLPGFGE